MLVPVLVALEVAGFAKVAGESEVAVCVGGTQAISGKNDLPQLRLHPHVLEYTGVLLSTGSSCKVLYV